jgi:carbon starvation protein
MGGINSMWPIFGIVNQLLAAVALSVATSVLMRQGKWRYAPVTLLPLIWLVSVTFSAAYQKVLNPAPNIGFLAHAKLLSSQASTANTSRLIRADYLNAGMTSFFVILVAVLVVESVSLWLRIVAGVKHAETHESAFVATRLVEGEL